MYLAAATLLLLASSSRANELSTTFAGWNGAGGGGLRHLSPLTTTFNDDNGAQGNSFDLTATDVCVRITNWDFNVGNRGADVTGNLYYREGTAAGFENTTTGWTQLGSPAQSVSLGWGNPTPFDFGEDLDIPAGETYGIFFILDTVDVSYTDGNATYTNGPLTLQAHSGISCVGRDRFVNCRIYTPRVVNTNIYYKAASDCDGIYDEEDGDGVFDKDDFQLCCP